MDLIKKISYKNPFNFFQWTCCTSLLTESYTHQGEAEALVASTPADIVGIDFRLFLLFHMKVDIISQTLCIFELKFNLISCD